MPVNTVLTIDQVHASPLTTLPELFIVLRERALASDVALITVASIEDLHAQLDSLKRKDPDRLLPLHGVPYVLKDNIDSPPYPTSCACPLYSSVPPAAATVVKALEAAGAILLGKANMDQFATGLVGTRSPYGAVPNPVHDDYISGGSSSGSAVVVARGVVPFALGTDTAGSGRVPAAMNGLVGLKPSRGVLSTKGVVPACASIDCVSIFANSTLDAAAVLSVITAYDPDDIFSRAVPPQQAISMQDVYSEFEAGLKVAQCKIGIPNSEHLDFSDDSGARASFEATVDAFKAIGATVVPVDFSVFSDAGKVLYEDAFVAERYSSVGPFIKENLEKHAESFDPVVAKIILNAEHWKGHQVFTAQQRMKALCRRAEGEIWPNIDILMVPSVPKALTIDDVRKEPVNTSRLLGTYTNFVNLMDLCAVAVPAVIASDDAVGVPRGCTIVAQAFKEREVLSAARALEVFNCRAKSGSIRS